MKVVARAQYLCQRDKYLIVKRGDEEREREGEPRPYTQVNRKRASQVCLFFTPNWTINRTHKLIRILS